MSLGITAPVRFGVWGPQNLQSSPGPVLHPVRQFPGIAGPQADVFQRTPKFGSVRVDNFAPLKDTDPEPIKRVDLDPPAPLQKLRRHKSKSKTEANKAESEQPSEQHYAFLKKSTPKEGTRLAYVTQIENSKYDVLGYQGRGNFSVVVTHPESHVRYVLLPGSMLNISGDTTVQVRGPAIEPTPAVNFMPDESALQKVTTQAVIMTAGTAERLMPFTDLKTAKAAMPMVDASAIARQARQLHAAGIRNIVVHAHKDRLNFKDELKQLQETLNENVEDSKDKVKINIVDIEKLPGTAGAILDALERGMIDRTEPVLVVAGDHLLNLNYSYLLNKHKETNAFMTLATQEQSGADNLSQFGLVYTGRKQPGEPAGLSKPVTGFDEKLPVIELKNRRIVDKNGIGTANINLGFYVLSPEAIDFVKELRDKKVGEGDKDGLDFGKEVCPRILSMSQKREGQGYNDGLFMAVPMKGYWRDFGKGIELYQSNLDLVHDGIPGQPALTNPGKLEQYYDKNTGAFYEKGAWKENDPVQVSGRVFVLNKPPALSHAKR